MKKPIILIIILWFTIHFANAQSDTIIFETQETDTIIMEEKGDNILNDFFTYYISKNKQQKKKRDYNYPKWYFEPYLAFGFIVGDIENSSAKILYGESYSWDFGLKSRYQISKIYSLTFNIGFLHNRYKIADGIENNILGTPYNLNNEENNFIINGERYKTWAFGFSIGNRFNFDKNRHRGAKGKYIELSIYGNYAYTRDYCIKFYGANEVLMELKYEDPVLFNPFEAGVQANLGFNWFSIWGRYRITDWFNSKYSNAELPKFSVGIAINI